jgi:integrase
LLYPLSYRRKVPIFSAHVDSLSIACIIGLTPVLTPLATVEVIIVKLAKKKTGNKAKATKRKTIREHVLPYAEFPLFPQGSGRWAKKIRGKLHYFGRWDGQDGTMWKEALADYQAKVDDLKAGRTPRVATDGLTVADLANRFLTTKRNLVDTSELTPRTFSDYHQSCARLVEAFGKNRLVSDLAADDFEALRKNLSKTRGAVALGNEIQRIRTVFKYAYDQGLIASPLRYGQSFQKPSAKVLRRERQKKGLRMFQAPELRHLIAEAGVPLKAMILLGINCGFGNHDVATLPLSAIDLNRGWIDYPRPKTGVNRRSPLWPETIAALRAAINKRPEPKGNTDDLLTFITKYGGSWAKSPAVTTNEENAKTVAKAVDNPLTKEFRKLLDKLDLHRDGLGFYALRHTFETTGGGSRDQVATSAIMGHAPAANDMSAVYREHVDDERLRAVTEHVRKWLWPSKAKGKRAK